jgi:hypothetical protein
MVSVPWSRLYYSIEQGMDFKVMVALRATTEER